MKKNFIEDMFEGLDHENMRLVEYLSIHCRGYTASAAKQLSEYHLNVLSEIDDIFLHNDTPIALLNTADGMLSFLVRKWIQVIYALRYEITAVHTTYSQFVAAVKAYDDTLVNRVVRAPFLILEYPELVSNADWARGKLLDAVQLKRNMLIVTSDFEKTKQVFGEVVSHTVNSMGVSVVDMKG